MRVLLRYRFCFFKQKTAYEVRISDWSSDVCSSDLIHPACLGADQAARIVEDMTAKQDGMAAVGHHDVAAVDDRGRGADLLEQEAVVDVRAGLLFQEIPGIGRERRRNEPADVELRGFAEDDAVLVEQEDGAGRRDGSEDIE